MVAGKIGHRTFLGSKTIFLITGLVLAVYLLAGWRAVLAHTDPTEMDTVAYLQAALQVRETGGILAHIPNLLNGVYREATQHPFYLLLISPFAENAARFFVTAKIVSYLIGGIFLAVFFLVVRKLFGTGTAGGAAWLWAANAAFLTLVTTVACEGLMGIFFIVFWFCLSRGRDDRRWWVAAGAASAAAYLTKSAGILTLPVFVVCAFWWSRDDLKKLVRSRAFWGFFAVFVLIALPLFIRNARVYGTPLYSDSSGVLWIDRWEEFSYERAAEGRFTMTRFLQEHSAGQIVRIFWEGIVHRDTRMIVDGLKPLTFWKAIDPEDLRGFYHRTVAWQEAWAFLIMSLAAAGWWVNRRHAAAAPTLVLWSVFAVFVGWYSKVFPETPPTRLLYPVLILVPVYAALGARYLWGVIRSRIPDRSLPSGSSLAAAASAVALAGLLFHGTWIRSDVRKSYEFPTVFRVQMAWSEAHTRPGEKVLVGDSFFNHLFYFKGGMRAVYLNWPKLDGMERVIDFVKTEGIRYAFVDLATALYNPQVFKEYYEVRRTGLLRRKELPPPFVSLPRDPRIPPIFDLYAVR